MSPIRKAVEILGGTTDLAKAVGVNPSFVSQWLNGTRPVPATRCRAIEIATDGKVTREDLRPDVFADAAA